MTEQTPTPKKRVTTTRRKKPEPKLTPIESEQDLGHKPTNPETLTSDQPKEVKKATTTKKPSEVEHTQPTPTDYVEMDEEMDLSHLNNGEDPLKDSVDAEPSDDELVTFVEEQVTSDRRGSPNYEIRPKLKDVEVDPKEAKDIQHPPLAAWVRNGRSLSTLASIADTRILEAQSGNGAARPNDYRTLSIHDENISTIELNAASFFARPGARWDNRLNRNDRSVKSGKINYKQTSENSSDAQIEFVLCKSLGLGQPLSVRLWHSGLVFAMGIPDKEFRLSMLEQINTAHLETLRRTNGIIHGASSYYVNRILIQSFMKLVVDSNIDKSLWPMINKLIDHRDLQHIARAMMQGSFIRGYNYVESCGGLKTVTDSDGKVVLDDEGKPKKELCQHINRTVIDFGLIDQIDSSMFTDWQTNFIGKSLSATKDTLEDIRKYQSEGKVHEPITVDIADNVSLHLKAPTVDKHIEIGEKWIDSIEQALRDTISVDVDDNTREEFINQRINATSALDVSHWIESFSINDQHHKSDTVVENFCRKLSNNEELRIKIHNKIRSGISERLGSAVAIPTERCPKCKMLSSEINDNGDAIYTIIDAVSRFFTLAVLNQ